MEFVVISKLWPFNRKSVYLILLTIGFTYLPCMIILYSPKFIADKMSDLVVYALGFAWIPIVLSFASSGILYTKELKRIAAIGFDLNPYQRSTAFMIGNIFCVWTAYRHINPSIDPEGFGLILFAYFMLATPLQIVSSCLFSFFVKSKNITHT